MPQISILDNIVLSLHFGNYSYQIWLQPTIISIMNLQIISINRSVYNQLVDYFLGEVDAY